MRAACVIVCIAATTALTRPAEAANARAEAAAQSALGKAESDFLAMNYATAAARLDKALRTCAPTNCSIATQAALLRDIGTMEFRAGDRGLAGNAFREAIKLQPNIDLNPSYDSPDLRAAWAEIKGGGAPAPAPAPAQSPTASPEPAASPSAPAVPPPPTFPQPTGDFTHTPVPEQKTDTPLPIYVEGGPVGVSHVIVRYKSQEEGDESEWNHIDLARVSNGWGGTIPCNAVLAGTVRYFIQAYNRDMDPVASNGDAKKPYQVPIREELHGPAPHLPGRAPPKACHATAKAKAAAPPPPPTQQQETSSEGQPATDCEPGTPGCDKHVEKTDTDEEPAPKAAPASRMKAPRIWVGASFALDILSIPAGDNLCLLHPNGPMGGQPLNDKLIYCTDPGNADFPTRNPAIGPGLNMQLFNNGMGQAGHSDGGDALGTMHLMASVDAVLSDNFLLGGRVGFTFNGYPGQAAQNDGHAARLPALYLEGRLTFVYGDRALARPGVAPVLFVGAGYGEFDGHLSGVAVVPPPMSGGVAQQVPVNFWVTSGPFFGAFGVGVRFSPVMRWALQAAVRANIATNGVGIVPSLGPELAIQYGF